MAQAKHHLATSKMLALLSAEHMTNHRWNLSIGLRCWCVCSHPTEGCCSFCPFILHPYSSTSTSTDKSPSESTPLSDHPRQDGSTGDALTTSTLLGRHVMIKASMEYVHHCLGSRCCSRLAKGDCSFFSNRPFVLSLLLVCLRICTLPKHPPSTITLGEMA